MWRSLKHKFLLPFLGIHEIRGQKLRQPFLVSPYMKNGTLSRWRKQANPPVVWIEERVRLDPFVPFFFHRTLILM